MIKIQVSSFKTLCFSVVTHISILLKKTIFKSYICKIKSIILKKLFPLCPCERSGKWTAKEK